MLPLLALLAYPTWADGDVVLSVDTGVARIATHADCSDQTATGLTIAGGTDSAQFYVKFGVAGAKNVASSAAGLTGISTVLDVVAPADPHTVNGWGCSSGGAASWLGLLVLLFYSSRRATAGSRRDARHAG